MEVLQRFWMVTAEMAPYLLFGFVIAGLLSMIMTHSFIKRHLGGGRFITVVKAALLGVPMPLCSCSVVPVTASLAKFGAGKGAAVSFLASTPQTGVDSILVTHALLGPIYTLVRVIVAFVSGIFTGAAVMIVTHDHTNRLHEEVVGPERRVTCREALSYGLLEMPADIGRELFVGLIITALLGTFIEPGQFSATIGSGWKGMLIMLATGIPVYVCSTASVPIAAGLILAGFSPGAVLVFLIAGPATNVATVLTMFKIIGKRETITYLLTLMATALLAGALVDNLGINESVQQTVEHACHDVHWFQHVAAVILMFLLLRKSFNRSSKKPGGCCSGKAAPVEKSGCSSREDDPKDKSGCCCSGKK